VGLLAYLESNSKY